MIPIELIKMLMISDLGDKLIQIFIGFLLIAVAYFAWRSTNITEPLPYRTILLLERRFRRRTRNNLRLTTHIQSTSIVSGTESEETNNSSEDQSVENTQSAEENKPPEASTSGQSEPNISNSSSNIEDQEIEDIVRIMDTDVNELRQRRLAYYEQQRHESPPTTSTESLTETQLNVQQKEPDEGTEVEVVEELIMEHNYAESGNVEDIEESATARSSNTNDSNIRIKLKYLNDELKLVDGRLEEQLGDFKRRHFQVEFSSNKIVRLIFNGQVLQPDTETLQSCGLFDNCVVHCLVHQQRNVFNDGSGGNSNFSGNSGGRSTGGLSQGSNNNQGRDWDLGNILLILVSIILGSAWYFRYEYAHLYTVTATVALVAITGIFTIFLIGVYFPDPEPQQPRTRQQQQQPPQQSVPT